MQSNKRIYRYIMRFLAILFIFSVAVDIAFIMHGLLRHQNTTLLQGFLGSASAAIGLMTLGIRQLIPERHGHINFQEFTRNLNKSRVSLIREEINAALLHLRNRPIDIKLTLLQTSDMVPAAHLMKFMSVEELFVSVTHGRMAAIGPPGAGKSLLALQFAFQVSSDQAKEDPWIPVIIPAQNWDQRTANLDYWLARQVCSILDIDKSTAWSLVKADIIVPIFDGLDEMDPAPDNPANAGEFIKVLNSWDRKFILTSRTDTWKFLEAAGYILEDACNVQLEPLTDRQVTEYLGLRNRSSGHGSPTRAIVRDLSRTLGSSLSTPFDLALIGSLLSRRENIDKLRQRIKASMTADEIEGELLRAFVEARVQWYPKHARNNRRQTTKYSHGKPRYYSVDDVLSWSRSLASFLKESGGTDIFGVKMPTTEISIERLWPIAGKRAPRIMDQILTALSWVPFLVVLGIQMSTRGTSPEVALSIIASLAVLPASSMWANRVWVHPSKIVLQRLLQPRRLLRLALGISVAVVITEIGSPGIPIAFAAYYGAGFALVFALGVATAVRDSISLPAFLTVGFLVGLAGMALTRLAVVPTGDTALSLASGMCGGAVGLVVGVKAGIRVAGRHGGGGLDILPAGLPTPLARLYGDFQAGLTAAFLSIAIGTVIGLTGQWPVKSVWGILLLCVLAGIAAGFGFVAATWRRHIAMLICARGGLPFQLTGFLRWAHSAGLLRTAGRSYEFRHRRLLDWLTR